MKYINREEYLETLRELKNKHLIKVITGVRRAGKSTLMRIFREEIAKDIDDKQIQFYNFEDPKYNELTNWRDVYNLIDKKLIKNKPNYIFLDEVQNINEFEKLLDGLYINENTDLYVTGSNAYLLSSELATLLTGRAYEINILPFSFKEFASTYTDFRTNSEKFADYLKYTSMPQAVELMHENPTLITDYLRQVYDSILERDILPRRQIYREQSFENVRNFALDTVGSQVSPNSISKSLAANNKTVDSRTVEDFLKVLTDCFLFYRIDRFDVKGKQHLATQEKYYIVDLGFRHAFLGKKSGDDRGHLLENLVFLELKRRGGQIFIGKMDNKEVDFVVKDRNNELSYYQVTYSVRSEATLKRELSVLQSIRDNHQKFLITMDEEEVNWDGVKQINVINWLLD